MIRRRNIPALISTIALIAGCGSQARAEVTGVVRDARTGRAIAGARVFAQDGAATRTDSQGRFTISVSEGLAREIRVSAAGRCDASTRLDVRVEVASPTETSASLEIELAPCAPDESRDRVTAWDGDRLHDPDAVLRWIDDLDWSAFRDRSVLEPDPAPGHEPAGAEVAPVWSEREQWALGSMALGSGVVGSGVVGSGVVGSGVVGSGVVGSGVVGSGVVGSGVVGSGVARPACAKCHDAASFAAAHPFSEGLSDGGLSDGGLSDGDACGACHASASDDGPQHGLRVYERVDDVGGAPARGLGSGAVCVECHRSTRDAPAHAPQADLLLGRGMRSVPARALGRGPRQSAPHAGIADTCVACHAPSWRDGDPETLTLGHTFRAGGGDGIARDACASCHGDVEPSSIGRRDWDGDGVPGSVSDEHERALARARRAIHARIAAARRRDRCGATAYAQGFAERDGVLWLTDARGRLLGDCDADGTLDPVGERGTSIDVLDVALRDAVIDLARLERDGSRGVHNPPLAFAALGALSR